MSNIPNDLTYTEEHEWFKSEGEAMLIGITDHAQDQLGDVVFLELPEVGSSIAKGDAFGVVESVKAVSDLFAPFDGEVVAVNVDLVDAPEKINTDAYGSWLIKVKPNGDALGMTAAEYQTLVEREA